MHIGGGLAGCLAMRTACWLTDFLIIHLSWPLIWRQHVSIRIFSPFVVIYKSQQPLLCLPLLSEKWWSMQLPQSQRMTCRTKRWVRCALPLCHTQSHRRSLAIITSGVCLCVTQGEKIIFEYFSDPEFIDQLIEFLSLEDRKGKDSFNPRRFCLFKVQFKLSASIDLANLLQRSDTAYHH